MTVVARCLLVLGLGVLIGCGDDAAPTDDGKSPVGEMDAGPKEPLKSPLDASNVIDLLDARTHRPPPDAMVDAGADGQVGDACVPSEELCNEADDDCDGKTDEGFDLGQACDGEDADECEDGEIVCDDDGSATCDDSRNGSPELCNGDDDDCDGEADEGFDLDTPCTEGIGACAVTGQRMCNASGSRAICDAEPAPPGTEICGDGIDQDCTGADLMCATNDAPANAQDISAGGLFTADLAGAVDDDPPGSTGCGNELGHDVFYTFTLPVPEVVYFDTIGSNFDTVLRLYSGACTSRTGHIKCNDDASGCSSTIASQLVTQLDAGTYCLVLDQYKDTVEGGGLSPGAAKLNFVRGGRPGTYLDWSAELVSGDTCGSMNYTHSATSGCGLGHTAAPDLGYYFTLCPAETVSFSANTCMNTTWDSVLYLYDANSPNDLACQDDTSGCGTGIQSSISGISVNGPGLFWLVVDGFDGEEPNCGTFDLHYAY